MSPTSVLLTQLCTAVFIGFNLPVACGSAPKEVRLIVEENDAKNETTEVELDVNMTEYIVTIPRGDDNKSVEFEKVMALKDSGDATEVVHGAELSRSFIGPIRPPVIGSQVKHFPKCAIGYMESGCVATFISPDRALTTASCVVDRNTWKGKNLDLWLGQTCKGPGKLMSGEGGAIFPEEYRYSTGYEDHDYAIILYKDESPCYLVAGDKGGVTNDGFKTFKSQRSARCRYPTIRSSSCDLYDEVGQNRFRCRRKVRSTGTYIGSPLVFYDTTSRETLYGIVTESTTAHNCGIRISRKQFCWIVSRVGADVYQPWCENLS